MYPTRTVPRTVGGLFKNHLCPPLIRMDDPGCGCGWGNRRGDMGSELTCNNGLTVTVRRWLPLAGISVRWACEQEMIDSIDGGSNGGGVGALRE